METEKKENRRAMNKEKGKAAWAMNNKGWADKGKKGTWRREKEGSDGRRLNGGG